MPKGRLWKPFVVPDHFLNSAGTASSPILCLPTEILVEIFNHAGPVDQLAFTLVCKHLLQVSTFVALKISSRVGEEVSHRSNIIEDLLRRIQPRNTAGRPSKAWSICVDCLQLRPTKRSYWQKKRPSRISESGWQKTVRAWNTHYSLQCPECYYDEVTPYE